MFQSTKQIKNITIIPVLRFLPSVQCCVIGTPRRGEGVKVSSPGESPWFTSMAWRIYPDSWEYWECTLIFHVILNTQSNFISKLGLVSNKFWEKERATCSHGHSQKREGALIYCWPTPHALQTAGYPSISVNGPHGLRKRAIRKLEEHSTSLPAVTSEISTYFNSPFQLPGHTIWSSESMAKCTELAMITIEHAASPS